MSEFETTGLNGSQFEPNFNNLALLESKILSMSDFESIFLTPVGIWLKNLTMHHILMGNFLLKIENTRKMSSLKTNFFRPSYTVKAAKLALSCFLANPVYENFLWRKIHYFNQIFGAAPHFEPCFWKHVGFWKKMFKHVIFWANISKFVKTIIEN